MLAALVAGLALPGAAFGGHALLDHPPQPFAPQGPLSSSFNSGGKGAEWELVDTIVTGNPHTDLDFFTQGGETFASVGTLAAGPNSGGQTIVKLTEGGEVSPSLHSAHPSASCLSNPSAATGLQHDVEATPKGEAILNAENKFADTSDTQLLIDATDAPGRCHDQGTLGISGAPRGGLEIVDVTDVENPVEIALTSHIGQAHTVNVDPKRPHIAYAVTSDAVGVSEDSGDIDGDGDTTELIRENEDPGDSDRFDLDGFEVVDLSSCMDFPAGTTTAEKRASCRPEVYRYRWPSVETALGHTLQTGANAVYGCHELEIYSDDMLTCGSGNALLALDMSGAFDDNGTPKDFTDDKPRGTPLDCRVRDNDTTPGFDTGAMVTDCVDGTAEGAEDLTVPAWLDAGAPSLEGVSALGAVHHQGRGAGGSATPAFDSTEDIDFNHEAERSESGKLLLATDERGGGILPPGASCAQGADNTAGNGGIHAYRVNALDTELPATPEEAFEPYALTPEGEKAIYRAPIRTGAQATVCTAHVFQQIPGQNRIFMGWYSQGTQVVDFIENKDGTVEFKEAAYWIPENANEWVSAIFKYRERKDGRFTYWGATGDFNLGERGRNAIDVYKVTLRAPPKPLKGGGKGGGGKGGPGGEGSIPKSCTLTTERTIAGTNKGETLTGTKGSDAILARGGRDTAVGLKGDDCVFGQGERDVLRGKGGDDFVTGGADRDNVKGNGGNDLLRGGAKKDRIRGAGGEDELRGQKGPDSLNGGAGRDLINGGAGRDRLRGGGGDDVLRGGRGNDVLRGGGGSNEIRCGKGNGDKAIVTGDDDDVKGCETVIRR